MININKKDNALVINFAKNDKFLFDGLIQVALNELMVVIDNSNMATFKRTSNGDTLFSLLISEIQIEGKPTTKETIITDFAKIGYTSGKDGGAVNSVNGKTGDVTITAEELGAATVEELNSKLDKMEAVSTNLTHVTIRPNVLYTFTGKPTSLTINFAAHEHQDEFIFKFSSGEVPTTLSLPKQISWIGSTPLKIEANKQYIVSIFAGIAVGGAF